MKLSKRLTAIYDMVPFGVAADIGSDHGKLIISLFEGKKIIKGYAVENKKGPYEGLVRAIERENMLSDITPLFSDGISELPNDANCIIIAGMGGLTIVDILLSHKERLSAVKSIIVDAHNCIPKVREEIIKLGYQIVDEKVIEEENTFYEIIRFDKGSIETLSSKELEFGPILMKEKSKEFLKKYQIRLNEIEYLLGKSDLPENKILELNNEKERINNIL